MNAAGNSWEPQRENPSYDWLRSHSMAAIGGSYAWPALTFSSDGEFIQLRLESETQPDVSAVRYLRDVTIDIPAAHFEQAVDKFLNDVEARLVLRVPNGRELIELRDELRAERQTAQLSTVCRLQALAGLDPGTATDDWVRLANALKEKAGGTAVEEILAVAPELQGGLVAADSAISAMIDSKTTVNLEWAAIKQGTAPAGEIPWARGARLAQELRERANMPSGPLMIDTLEQLLGARLPLPKSVWAGQRKLLGGYRNGTTNGRTAVLVTKDREDSQRFYLARLVAAACVSSADQHVLPVSETFTAFQKFERSFAQEFLCPWQDLDTFTDECGTDEDGIAAAAERFIVSERLVLLTLVNRGKIPRNRLQV